VTADRTASGPEAVAVDAAAEVGVHNSQPEGIGRVVAIGALTCWNNLGRNVVFADASLRPVAVFGDTLFPDDDEASQYDLDVHAILHAVELGLVLVLNHLGTVRGFACAGLVRRGPVRQVQPTAIGSFAADVERSVIAGGRLIGSCPRSDGAIGVLVSRPLRDGIGDALAVERGAERFGEITALGHVGGAGDDLVALGGERHVALVPVSDQGLGRWRWKRELPFRVAVLFDDGDVLWAAGPDATGRRTDDYDWDQLRGGGFAVLDRDDGALLAHGALPSPVAWGTGGVAVVPIGRGLAVVARDGAVHIVDPTKPERARATAPLARSSLGIAHAAVTGGRVLYGFNRGGYRLHSWDPGGRPAGRHRRA
jgi:hypothetical protein